MTDESTIESVVYELTAPRTLTKKKVLLDLGKLGHDEVAATTLVSAISPGTEVAAFTGQPPLRPGPVYPRVVGYCNIAEVVAIGPAVLGVAVGDRIATHQSHRSAFICKASEVLSVISADADMGEAATTYLFHLGYSALLRCAPRPGDFLGVIGLGTLGLTTSAVAALGGLTVFAFSDQERPSDLTDFGINQTFSKQLKELPAEIATTSGNVGIDLVVTTSNLWSDWLLALQLVRAGGSIAVTGFPGRGVGLPDFNPLDSQYFYDKQLTISACGYVSDLDLPARDVRYSLKRNFRYLLSQIELGRLPAKNLISDRVSWNELGTAYDRLADREPQLRTFVLEWR